MNTIQIMTVDDERHVHEGLDTIIDWQALGCSHGLKASNGAEALELIETHRPGIIITDVKMPVMDGIELISKVRLLKGYSPSIIIMSGYNEFEYAQAALRYRVTDYLLKPVDEDELTGCLKRILASGDFAAASERRAMASTVYRRLAVHPGSVNIEDFHSILNAEEAPPPYAFGMLIPFAGSHREDSPDGVPNPDMLQMILATLKDKGTAGCVYQEAGGALGILLSGNVLKSGGNTKELELKGFYRMLCSRLPCETRFVIGRAVDGLSAIHDSRQSVLEYLSSCYLMSTSGYTLVPGGNTCDTAGCVSRISIDELMNGIDESSRQKVWKTLDDFLADIRKNGISTCNFRDWISLVLYEVLRLVSGLGGQEPGTTRAVRAILGNLEYIPLEEIRRTLVMFLSDAIEQTAALRVSMRHSSVIMIQRALERRCTEELTLVELAEDLKMNPVYLGQLFKQVIGKSFKDYQREIRMKEACRLLRETNMKVVDIARKVGYNCYDYFVEQFKREMKATPSAFRRS